MPEVWERQPRERNLWYDRFTRFRLQGPGRSLLSAYNEEKVRKGQKRSDSPALSWRKAAERWQWRERAEAWDESERQRLEKEEMHRAEAARRSRLLIVERGLVPVFDEITRVARITRDKEGQLTKGKISVSDAVMLERLSRILANFSREQRLDFGELTDRAGMEHSGPHGGPIEHRRWIDLAGLDDAELDQLIDNLETAIRAGANRAAAPAGASTEPAPVGDRMPGDAGT